MKKVLSVIGILALGLLTNISTAAAQGPSGSFVSGVSCVDISGAGAAIAVEVFNSSGSLGSFGDSIGPGGNKLYFTGSAGDKIGSLLTSGTAGSVVVSSDNQIACSVNTQTNGGTLRVGTSNGLAPEATATKIYVPQALRIYNGSNLVFGSYVAVQNAGGSGETTVTAKFFNSAGTEVVAAQQTANIQPNSSHIFFQDTNANLGAGFNGSATFESDDGTKLAGTVVLFDGSSTLLTYDAFASGASNIIGPRFVKNPSGTNLQSGLACQNLGGSATTITANFSINDGSLKTGQVSKNVGPNQSFLLSSTNFGNATLDGIASGTGSVKVSGGGAQIACTFNENATAPGTGLNFTGNGTTYNGINASNATNSVSFPQVVALGGNSFRGGFQYANTTGTAATCSHTYSDSTGVLGTVSNVALGANGSNPIFAETDLTNAGGSLAGKAQSFNGSVKVTCNQPIVGIYNLAALPLGGDSFTTNTGVNVP